MTTRPRTRASRRHAYLAIGWWVVSWAMAAFGGILFAAAEHLPLHRGIYWALTTVTTVGYGDITPHNGSGYFIADFTMALTIPIWSLAIAFATSWITSWHIWHSNHQLTNHITLTHKTPIQTPTKEKSSDLRARRRGTNPQPAPEHSADERARKPRANCHHNLEELPADQGGDL